MLDNSRSRRRALRHRGLTEYGKVWVVRIFLPGTKLLASIKGSGYQPVVHLVGEGGVVTLKETEDSQIFRNPEDALKAARSLVDRVEQQVRMALSKAGIEEIEN